MLKQVAKPFGDELDLAEYEELIPSDLESRIIRQKINSEAVDLAELGRYIMSFCDFNILEMDSAIVQMYFVEKLVHKMIEGSYLDSAKLLSQSGSLQRQNSECYRIQNSGRSFHIWGKPDTSQYRIMGAMELKKGDEKRIIIIDPRCSVKLNINVSDGLFAGASYLVNSGEICVIRTYPLNFFKGALAREQRTLRLNKTGGILAYMHENQGLYCVVYSWNRGGLRKLAHQALIGKR